MIGTRSAVHITTAGDDGIALRSVDVGGLVDITAIFAPDVRTTPFLTPLTQAIAHHSLRHGLSAKRTEDDYLRVLVKEVRPGAENDVEKALRVDIDSRLEADSDGAGFTGVTPRRSPRPGPLPRRITRPGAGERPTTAARLEADKLSAG
ncbi:hypothetical protein [Actinomadura sp. HBU206391]|uniref:hypothetical protein n=1 Tax=Actinomadura sp. HBU206391 TaxID=2731692 RepID=UPI001650B493|nr:hypothetical protein [Actinomadura sp. HBU206391]MBC6456820.1 hypothetical protein [Actinomadura sp. HBU206391]